LAVWVAVRISSCVWSEPVEIEEVRE